MSDKVHVHTCDATVFMYEPSLGGVWLPCQLAPGHDGFHSASMNGCVPPAELTWFSGSEVS